MSLERARPAPISDRPAPILALPSCVLGLRGGEELIEEIVFLPPGIGLETAASPIEKLFVQEIGHYLSDPAYRPRLPLKARGTAFQNRVWQAILDIPCGQTLSYGEIARTLGSSPRAVGQACGANPFPLVVPCHRVLARASLGGFARQNADWLIRTKEWLLAHEKPR